MRRLMWTIALWLCLPGLGAAATLEGVVTRIADGDALTVAGRGVRLQGIDAPESDQLYGGKASAALQRAGLSERVRLKIRGTDKYGRLIAIVYHNGRNINRWLVRDGHAS